MTNTTYHVNNGGYLSGTITVPGDKSISHRAIMLGSLAKGTTEVQGFLQGEDSLHTLQAFRALGVEISPPAKHQVTIRGVGLHGLQAPTEPLYLGNSGTSMRLLAGILAAQSFTTTLTGDASLSKRPMQRVTAPLRQMGATIIDQNGMPPLQIQGQPKLQAIDYVLPMASAQVKSCILLAGLYANGTTSVTEPAVTRDHTERMLQAFAYPIQRQGNRITLTGGHSLQATAITVPADISSAAFFLVGASIAAKSDLVLSQVGINPSRTGVLTILEKMGADISLSKQTMLGGEPVADIRIRAAKLHGIDIPVALVPLAIDEFPVLFIAAACATGRTILRGAAELRVKESDRIQVMADGLTTLGIQTEVTPDGIIIEGGDLQGGQINSHGDHRIAMAFAMAGLCAKDKIIITDCANVNTSFPGFVDLARSAGLNIQAKTI